MGARLTDAVPSTVPSAAPYVRASDVLQAGVLVALLDGLFATAVYVWVLRVTTFPKLWQGVATSLLGPAAREGGTATMLAGLAIHLGVAFGWTVTYALLLSALPALRRFTSDRRGAIVAGVLYGMLVWTLMDLVLVPLTRAKPTPYLSMYGIIQLLGHPFSVGLPIALVVGREVRRIARSRSRGAPPNVGA